ncbi:MAG TPA: DUF58 domain-containing protein [Stellaceae bacterium]|jgi:uncharacterized protein (DUF58 family)|nr:DUF58 domain-containing protein [Stellaceae bacterium]
MIRPTPYAVFAFALGVPAALVLLIVYPSLWAFSLDYGALILALTLLDLWLALPARLLTVELNLPERIFIGESGAITVSLAARGLRRMMPIELLAELRGEIDPPLLVTAALPAGETLRVPLTITPRRRGKVAIDRLWLRWRGPLSLVAVTKIVPVGRDMDAVPNVRSVRNAALQFFTQEAIYGVKAQRHRGDGTEFSALREYVPGYDSRFIDWKHSARHHKLLCKEFDTERNHQIILAFDTGYLMSEPVDGIPRLDHAIAAGLLLAYVSMHSGDLVGTFAFDATVRQYYAPIQGIAKFPRLQHATAELDYRHEETNFTLGLAELGARLRRRALVVVFTEFVDTVTAELLVESLQRIAGRHVVVFVTLRDSLLQRLVGAPPVRFANVAEAVLAHDFLQERQIVFEKLSRLGVHCLDVSSGGVSTALINRYLHIKERGLL